MFAPKPDNDAAGSGALLHPRGWSRNIEAAAEAPVRRSAIRDAADTNGAMPLHRSLLAAFPHPQSGVKVELPTGRTTLTPLSLGMWHPTYFPQML
jgi:hypothetical protein